MSAGRPPRAAPLVRAILGGVALLATSVAGARAEDSPAAPPPVEVRGTLAGRTTWSGTVLVTGDVEIPAGAGLVVEPGTRIVLAARDASSSGWNPDRVEIHVKGDLLVAGSVENPVLVGPEGAPPEIPAEAENVRGVPGERLASDLRRYPWHGIVLWPGTGPAPRREIRGARFASAFAAIQVPAGRARIEDCVFLDCAVGVEAGSAYADHLRFGTKGGVARPTVLRSRFAGCGTGVFGQSGGAPRVEASVFAYCVFGVAGKRTTGRNYPVGEPGATAARCAFHGNGTGVETPALVSATLFTRNDRAVELSSFHAVHSTGVDQFRVTGSVSFGDGELLRVESVGDGVLALEIWPYSATPGAFSAAVRAPWPPLPDALRLEEDSVASFASEDNGPAGCLGGPSRQVGAGGIIVGTPLPPPLAAAVAGGAAADIADLARARPAAGAPLRGSWWSTAPVTDAGAVALRPLGGADGGVVALGWRLKCDRAVAGVLLVNGDLDGVGIWWNGDACAAPRVPRRAGRAGDAHVGVKVKSGVNLLVIGARGRGATPALGVRLVASDGATVTPAEVPPETREVSVTSAAVVRPKGRDGAWLRLALSAPVGWTAPGEVIPLDHTGERLPAGAARVVVDERQVVLFGPLPDTVPAAFLVRVSGFASPEGSPCVFPAEPVVVK